MKANIEEIVVARLRETHGWTGDQVWKSRAAKSFQTTVGLKEAAARVITSSQVEQYTLMASCLHEGSNVLHGCIGYIPEGAKVETIYAIVDVFAEQVDLYMANSFEYQLLAA